MADDYEEQGYDPGTSEQNSEPAYQEPYQEAPPQEGVNTSNEPLSVPDEYGAVPAEGGEEQGPPDERGWVRKLIDDVRSTFGINEEAVPSGEEQQAPPEGTDSASFDRKTGAAGGVRERPREPTAYNAGEESARATGNVERAGAVVSGVAKNLFGAEQPEAGDTMRKIKEYVMGEGGMPNAERKAREAQFAANGGNQNMTKSELREGALKQAAMEGLDKGGAMLQNYRTNQQNYKGLAAAALDHGDRDSAAKLFNEGHSFVPDGAHAVASPSANGVLMAVRNSATGDTKSTLLTDDQFRDMLHNRSGEFDHLTDQGLQKMIDQVARTPGMPKPNQMSNAQPGGAGVANTPGATVPGQVGPTAATPAMQGAGVSNLPQGAGVPQVGNQSALPSETPLPRPNPVREAAPAAARGPSASDRADALLGRPAGTGQQARANGRDPDGWPTGIPRGGQFANTGGATRDFSQPTTFGNRGHVNSVGAAGSRGVYDVRGHTYDVGKDGLPIAKEGQPGFRGPGPGQPNWTGTQSDKINTRQAGDVRPQVIQRQPYAQQRAQDANAIKREGLEVKRALGQGNLGVKQEANEIKRDLGTKGNELKGRDIESKVDTRARSVGVRENENVRKVEQGNRAADQRDDKLQFLRQQSDGKLNEAAMLRLSRETNSDVRGVLGYIDTKVKSGEPLTPKEQQYVDMIRERTGRARQSP